jgi:hypothetical protein
LLIWKRWLDLGLLTAIAVLIWLVFSPVILAVCLYLIHLLKDLPPWMSQAVNALLVVGLWSIIIKLGGFGLGDILSSTFLSHPPVWFFGLLGAAIYLGFLARYNIAQINSTAPPCTSAFVFSVLLGIVVAWLISRPASPQRRHVRRRMVEANPGFDLQSMTKDPGRLLGWIDRESPVTIPSDDLFGLNSVAKRVARILVREEAGTIGIVGPYGSGKTSLLNMVEHHLLSHSEDWSEISDYAFKSKFSGKIILCRVDGWGRTKGSPAQQILTIAVKRLSQELDCMSVITAPARYQDALAKSKNAMATVIAALLNSDEDPVAILSRIDTILEAAHFRLLIFLEDLDRNISDTLIRDEMPALLDRLRGLNNISFILAIGTERHYSSILIRICDHVENIS